MDSDFLVLQMMGILSPLMTSGPYIGIPITCNFYLIPCRTSEPCFIAQNLLQHIDVLKVDCFFKRHLISIILDCFVNLSPGQKQITLVFLACQKMIQESTLKYLQSYVFMFLLLQHPSVIENMMN